jgi:V-type H+-transporting ATPase proteolipid subunit
MTNVAPELWTALGAALGVFLSAAGACYASAHAGIFAVRFNSELSLKSFFPIIISGVLAIYGAIIGVLLAFKLNDPDDISQQAAHNYFAAGLAVGSACLCSGGGIGLFMKEYSRLSGSSARKLYSSPETQSLLSNEQSQQNQSPVQHHMILSHVNMSEGFNFWSLILVLVFMEAIGLYGLVVALFFIGR